MKNLIKTEQLIFDKDYLDIINEGPKGWKTQKKPKTKLKSSNIKYHNTAVGFKEFPNEITLLINITNCPCHCPGCHSQYLAEDIGEILDEKSIDNLIKKNDGITCVGFMGGDADPKEIERLANYVKSKGLKIGWYSGRDYKYNNINYNTFDYYKIGSWKQELGGLDSKTTNQKMFRWDGTFFTWKDFF